MHGLSFTSSGMSTARTDGAYTPVTANYTYEDKRDVKTQVLNKAGARVISQYDYRYNAVGNRTSVVNSGEAFGSQHPAASPENREGFNLKRKPKTFKNPTHTNDIGGGVPSSPGFRFPVSVRMGQVFWAVGCLDQVFIEHWHILQFFFGKRFTYPAAWAKRTSV
ncbi:MAG: hypothetical protein HZB23_03030 [Deltaproteobacteria bacterium]|nr:hypothetical protein [Deltaproteobacteria bacterium]